MSWDAWFWLVLDSVLITWIIWCVRAPIPMPDDWVTRVPPVDGPAVDGPAGGE